MATTIVTPKSSTKLIVKQSSLQFPINYSGENGLSSMLAEMITAGKSVEYIKTSEFINGTIPNVPDGYVQAAYQIPGAIQQNVIAGSDNITTIKNIDIYVIGSASDKFTSNFQLKMFQGKFTIGSTVTPVYTVGQEILLIFYKNTNVGISSFGGGINKGGIQTAKFLQSTIAAIRMVYVDTNELIIVETNFNSGIVQKWDTLKTANKAYLVDALNELYDLAFAGGAGPAGGVLTGNYPNPTIKANGIVNSMIGQYQVNERTIAANSISTSRIMDGAIIGDKIMDGAVIRSKIATGAVGAEQLGVDSVIENRIRDLNVSTSKIQDGAITTAKIANLAVGTANLAKGAVITSKIADENVTTDKIASEAITFDKIADYAVNNFKIADKAVTATKLGSDLIPHVRMGFVNLLINLGALIVVENENTFLNEEFSVVVAPWQQGSAKGMQIGFRDSSQYNTLRGVQLSVMSLAGRADDLNWSFDAGAKLLYIGYKAAYAGNEMMNVLMFFSL